MSGIQLFEGATVVVVSKIVVVVVEDVVDSGTVLTLSSTTESLVPHKTNTKTILNQTKKQQLTQTP